MLEDILKETANEYGFTPEDLKGRDRHKTISHVRQVAMYNMMVRTDCTLQECGDLLGGRSPSTITQGFQKIVAERELGRTVELTTPSSRTPTLDRLLGVY